LFGQVSLESDSFLNMEGFEVAKLAVGLEAMDRLYDRVERRLAVPLGIP